MSQLEEFAKYVLERLANDRDWSSDTTDDIAAEAMGRSLATGDEDGFFVVVQPLPETSIEIVQLRHALQAILSSEDSTLGDGGSILGDDLRALAEQALGKIGAK